MEWFEWWREALQLDADRGYLILLELACVLVIAIAIFRRFSAYAATTEESGPVAWIRRHPGFTAFTVLVYAIWLISIPLPWSLTAFKAVSLICGAWMIIGLAASFIRDRFWADSVSFALFASTAFAGFAWLGDGVRYLDRIKIELGNYTVTAWGILAGITAFVIALWICLGVARLIEQKLERFTNFSPSLRVLIAKTIRIVLIFLAIAISIGSVGIDLTALTVFGGAIGLGLGFGLQKVVSNLVCGFILLTDRSIKPGDVVEIGGTYGWINNLRARYVSVITRDGTEHLIPNEDLVTQRVVNWSFTNNLVRFRTPVGISYNADPHKAIAVITEVAESIGRILKDPAPKVLVTGFGDSSVDLEIRCWIADPVNGLGNIRSELLLKIWDAFKENGIEIPFPQRDVHIRSHFQSEKKDTESN